MSTDFCIGHNGTVPVMMNRDRLLETRLLLTASSGGGKSWAMRRLLEILAATTQTIVIDPDGEFATLREHNDMILVGGEGDLPAEPRSAALLCRRIMELGVSAVLDIYELSPANRRLFVANFLTEMIDLPKKYWHPCFVAIDEAHELAPNTKDKSYVSAEPIALLFSKGRKRGYAPIIATQRLSKLSMDVAAEARNRMIGLQNLDLDQKRAADFLGWGKDQWLALRDLSPPGQEGQFFGIGPAFVSRGINKFRVDKVTTTHPKAGQGVTQLKPPKPSVAVAEMLAALKDLPQQAEAEIRDMATAKARIVELEHQLKTSPAATPDRSADVLRLRQLLKEAIQTMERVTHIQEPVKVDTSQLQTIITQTVERVAALVGDSAKTQTATIERLKTEARHAITRLQTALGDSVTVVLPPIAKSAAAVPAQPLRVPTAAGTQDLQISTASLKILTALTWWEVIGVSPVDKPLVAVIAGYTVNGHFNNLVGSLKTQGLIDYPSPGQLALTPDGSVYAQQPKTPPSLSELHDMWKAKLSSAQWKLVENVMAAYPRALTKEELATQSGYTVNGHFNNLLGSLRSLELVPERGDLAATELLFPPRLTGR